MEPVSSSSRSAAPVVFIDGIGERMPAVGGANEALEVLKISNELTAVSTFEPAVREQALRLAEFRHDAFARVRAVERLDVRASTLVVISDRVRGVRLSEVLERAERQRLPIDLQAALCLTRQLVTAVAALHDAAPDSCHGAIAPERIVITPEGRLVVVEYVLGPALEELRFSQERYWRELGIALPHTFGLPQFDLFADVTQVGVVALSLILGRALRPEEYPNAIGDVVDNAQTRSEFGASEGLPVLLRAWLRSALQLEPRHSFVSAVGAKRDLEIALSQADPEAERASLRAFLARYAEAALSTAGVAEGTAVNDTPAASAAPPAVVSPSVVSASVMSANVTSANVTSANVTSANPVSANVPSPDVVSADVVAASVVSTSVVPANVVSANVVSGNVLPGNVSRNVVAATVRAAADIPAGGFSASTASAVAHSAGAAFSHGPFAPDLASIAVLGGGMSSDALASVTTAAQMPPSDEAPWTPAARPVQPAALGDTPMGQVDSRPATEPAADRPSAFGASLATTLRPSTLSFDEVPEPLALDEDVEPAPEQVTPVWRRPLVAAAVAAALIVTTLGFTLLRPGAAPTPSDAGVLIVGTNPIGVEVLVDGVRRGATPLNLSLPAGEHVLELVANGEKRRIPVTLQAGGQVQQYFELSAAAPAASRGSLQVRTDPPDVRVTVDGRLVGRSPTVVSDLEPGAHSVVLEAGDVKLTEQVVIEAGVTASLVVPMQRAAVGASSGWISVSAPAEIQIFENQRLLGSSRSDRIMVAAGRHELELVNESLGFKTSRTVEVQAGKVSAVRPEWPRGSVALNAIPWAEVFVDGDRLGETPIGSAALPIGVHEVVFRHPDLGERRASAIITAGVPARLSVDMRAK